MEVGWRRWVQREPGPRSRRHAVRDCPSGAPVCHRSATRAQVEISLAAKHQCHGLHCTGDRARRHHLPTARRPRARHKSARQDAFRVAASRRAASSRFPCPISRRHALRRHGQLFCSRHPNRRPTVRGPNQEQPDNRAALIAEDIADEMQVSDLDSRHCSESIHLRNSATRFNLRHLRPKPLRAGKILC